MSVVSLLGVKNLNNPAPFTASYQFEITFECLEQLQKDLEWKLTYVGSATSSEYDQELDSLLVGPIPVGVNKFIFEADAPDVKRIPTSEMLGVTVILLTCSYDGREFVRVGYYVNNEYDSEELAAEPPAKPIIERIRRNVLAEKPRVTRFAIKCGAYGAEERELEAALLKELEESNKPAEGDDHEMDGADAPAGKDDDEDDISDAESEDLEAESDDDEDDLDEEEGGDADEDVEMGDDAEHKDDAAKPTHQAQPELMVH
ncbi:hypothetical protein N7457_000248 [Penicillium paradoxum]|uniref:uncharacterized protein n=1 Tax=Penicillium paradoxum TaxID=176176 RepID=UPI002546ECCC|nr:uncharacterized protein N7457_000248 [Penicillium paradoxum]KAJ5793649.1 hypothetical protein N7457_000248 [Penicillium paradoxum]